MSPVSVVVGGEQGTLRSGMFGFASDDEAGALGPAAGVHLIGEVDHMRPAFLPLGLLPLVGLFPLGFLFVGFWGQGRYPTPVVYVYLSEGGLNVVGPRPRTRCCVGGTPQRRRDPRPSPYEPAPAGQPIGGRHRRGVPPRSGRVTPQ